MRFSQLTGRKTNNVFTTALWQSADCIAAVVVSGDHSYSRNSVIVFLEHLIKQLLNENITVLHI